MFKVINAKTNRVLATCKTRKQAMSKAHSISLAKGTHYDDFYSSYKIVEA